MEADFPIHSKAFLNVCISGRSIDDAWLKIKQRTILHHFLALCRLCNNHKLIHWALVETMANYGIGVPQVSKRSPSSRNFNCDIETAFRHLNRIYDSSQKAVTDLINSKNTISVVCDNYQHSIQHNFQVEGKSAIFHRGTFFSLKQDRWFDLPMGTIMMSPNGLRWSVFQCEVVTQYIRL